MEDQIETVEGEECPICHEKTCTLTQMRRMIPWIDKDIPIFVFSMTCSSCKYHKSDVEFEQEGEPVKYTLDVESEEDMKIRIIKSGEGTVKIPHIMTIESGPTSNGYITNVEGLLKRVEQAIKQAMEASEEEEDKKKMKNMLKKLTKIMWGQEKQRIIIEDPTGNSAIISPKAVKSKL